MTPPSKGEEFAKLIEFLRRAQESAAMLSHLYADESKVKSTGWMAISEGMKLMQKNCTDIATKGLQ